MNKLFLNMNMQLTFIDNSFLFKFFFHVKSQKTKFLKLLLFLFFEKKRRNKHNPE